MRLFRALLRARGDAAPIYAFPSRERPRLFLHAGTALQFFRETAWLPAYRPVARLRRWLLRTAFALPQARVSLHLPPDSATAQPPLEVPEEVLRWFVGHRMVGRIGTEDARQKLTLLLLDARSQLVRVAKYGCLPLARQLLRQEAVMLASLPPDTGPQLLAEFSMENDLAGQLIIFEPVQGQPIPARLHASPDAAEWRQIDAFVDKLAQTVPTSAQDFAKQEVMFAPTEHPALAELLRTDTRAAEWLRHLQDRKWPVVSEHGDFAPWNLLKTPRGIRAIDWEDGRLKGFPGFDIAHYVVQTATLIHHWPLERTRSYAEARLRAAGLGHCHAPWILRLAMLRDYAATAPGEQTQLQAARRALMD